MHAPCGIRTHNLSRRAAEDLRRRPRDYWDRLLASSTYGKNVSVEGIYICLFTSRTAVVFRSNMLRNSESNTYYA